MQGSSQFLSMVRNFMIQLHAELKQPNFVQLEHIESIDRAVVELKKGHQNLQNLQIQNNQFATSRQAMKDYQKESEHLEKRLNRKGEQIQILKETVKTLYADNQKIVKQKQETAKEVISLKQQVASLKKKLKRQEDEMGSHKSELQKISSLAEERLNQYLKEDQQNKLKIKRLQSDNQKMKGDLSKRDRTISINIKKIEELKHLQTQYENLLATSENYKFQNGHLKDEIESTKSKIHQEKIRILQENESLLKQIENLNHKCSVVAEQKNQLEMRFQSQIEKSHSYEEQIVLRSEKLKEKNKQIKVYNDEIEKLGKRVRELSQMAEEFITQNRGLSEKCRMLQMKLEDFKVLYSHVGKLKGEITQKKTAQFSRLIESINRLQASL